MRRTGIDLSPTRCIVIDAEPGRRSASGATAVRVHRHASLDVEGDVGALSSRLALLLDEGYSKHASVNVWGLRSVHQYFLLPDTDPTDVRAAARRHAAGALGIEETELSVSVISGAQRAEAGRAPKREVSVYAVPRSELEAALEPFATAGFTIDAATTPCGALWSQSRLMTPSVSTVYAHVAVGALQSAIGIFSGGALLYARDLDWGYEGSADPGFLPVREEIAHRLATDLRHSFLYLKQYWEDDVSQVLLCGDMPDVRSLTAPLIERLNVEVETLDTLAGVDVTSLPEGFTDAAAASRLAMSIAVSPPPANLMPAPDRGPVRRRRVFAIGTAAALVASAFMYARAEALRTASEAEAAQLESRLADLTAAQASVPPPEESPAIVQSRVAIDVLDLAASVPPPARTTALQLSSDADGWLLKVDVEGPQGQPVARAAIEDLLKRLSASDRALTSDVSWAPSVNGSRAEMTARIRNGP